MRLIDLDTIMAQFPDADFDGDVIENMKAYPYWKIGIDGLINVLKAVPIIEQSEDCISRLETISAIQDKYYDNATGIDIVDIVAHLPSVIPRNNLEATSQDVEDSYNLGYDCGYNDAMSDVAGSEEEGE